MTAVKRQSAMAGASMLMYCGSIATRTMMMLLYALLVALILLSTNNNVLAFARTSPHQSIPITQTSSTQQHQLTAVTNDIMPFCAEATSIYNNINNSWDVNTNRLDKDNNTNDNSIRSYDVTSPRSWMEHIEHSSNEQPHGIGAYTVIRCDATYNSKHNTCQWKIWGIGFHMNRLCSSYRLLMKHDNMDTRYTFSSDYESKLQSNDIITSLLNEATESLLKEEEASPTSKPKKDEEYVRTLMVTILWTPPNKVVNDSTANYKPIIRGHSTFAGEARATNSNDDLFPYPISACLGIPFELTSEELAKLPKRYSNDNDNIKSQSLVGPNAKISSWCRIRKPLEDPTRFKVPDSNIGEVLLVTQDENNYSDQQEEEEEDFIILEGLTSNLFIKYKDGTIRTAPVNKVLLGYARHLVKEEINEHRQDLQLILNPPTIQDAKDGLWSEVFITSAIRLIVPVNRVLIPSGDDNEEPTVLWESNDHSVTQLLWSAICSRGNKSAAVYDSSVKE